MDFWYVVRSKTSIPQYCSNYYLAQAVARNIERRYCVPTTIENYNNQTPMLLQNMNGGCRVFMLELCQREYLVNWIFLDETLKVIWPDRHHASIKNRIAEYWKSAENDKKYDSFNKFHTPLGSLCLTLNQAEQFYNSIVLGK